MGILLNSFTIEIDQISKRDWQSNIKRFDDATIMQTWDFAEIIAKAQLGYVSRMVLYRNRKITAMAQVRIISLPFISVGVAYIIYGPLWKRIGEKRDYKNFKAVFKALYEEYAVKQKLFLRIRPNIVSDEKQTANQILWGIGFRPSQKAAVYRTILLDISRSLSDIRMGFKKRWRQSLNRAERNPLDIKTGKSQKEYKDFMMVYSEMLEQKGFTPEVNTERWEKIINKLPFNEKPNILMGYHKEKPVSGMILSNLGDTGFPILAATNMAGRKQYGSYPIFWLAIKWLKESGCQKFDLGGIDPANVPSTYLYKRGLGGEETAYIGQFEACCNPLSRLFVFWGEFLKKLVLNRKNCIFPKRHE